MNTPAAPPSDPARVLALLAEYTFRLDTLDDAGRKCPLLPAAADLARHASALIEHGAISTVEKIALRLRLAEFEAALKEAEGWCSVRV